MSTVQSGTAVCNKFVQTKNRMCATQTIEMKRNCLLMCPSDLGFWRT